MQTKQINITSERRTKLTHRNIESTLATSLLYKIGTTLVTTCMKSTDGTKTQLQQFRPFCNHGNRHVAESWRFLADPVWVICFLCLPRMNSFLMSHNNSTWMYCFHLFSWTFMLHCLCLRGQTRAIPLQIYCQYAGGSGAARPNPQESGLHAYHTFAI